jgi:hypothetical protein
MTVHLELAAMTLAQRLDRGLRCSGSKPTSTCEDGLQAFVEAWLDHMGDHNDWSGRSYIDALSAEPNAGRRALMFKYERRLFTDRFDSFRA